MGVGFFVGFFLLFCSLVGTSIKTLRFNSKNAAELTPMRGKKVIKTNEKNPRHLMDLFPPWGRRGDWKGEWKGRGLFLRMIFSQISLAASLCCRACSVTAGEKTFFRAQSRDFSSLVAALYCVPSSTFRGIKSVRDPSFASRLLAYTRLGSCIAFSACAAHRQTRCSALTTVISPLKEAGSGHAHSNPRFTLFLFVCPEREKAKAGP